MLASNTLLFRTNHMQVAAVVNGKQSKLVRVTLGEDLGEQVQVVHGLRGDEPVIVNPLDSLTDGERQQPAQGKAQDKRASGEH